MSVNWTAILQTLGGSAILVGALAWLAKAIINNSLSKDLESKKTELKLEADRHLEKLREDFTREIEGLKHQAQRDMEKYKTELTSQASKEERIRGEVIRWANPIFGAVKDLEKRLNNILNNAGYLALSKAYTPDLVPNWALSYTYFTQSTYYLFAQYFCWIRLFQERISFELFETPNAKDEFFAFIAAVNRSLGSYPLDGLASCKGPDTQVFALQQRGLGEAMIEGENESGRCMSYHKFLKVFNDSIIQSHLAPLQALVEDLTPDHECRWKRLILTKEALTKLAGYCEDLLKLK